MNNGAAQPITEVIRKFLSEKFSDTELTTLCNDYFVEVYNDFSDGMSKGDKIQRLLDYCQRREVMPSLLAALQRARPEQYARAFPHEAPAPKPKTHKRDPARIFISHAHQDTGIAHRLAGDLEKQGWRVWITPESIQPGEMWGEAIQRGLDECGVFITLLTPEAVASNWVSRETYTAIDLQHQGKLRVIPAELKRSKIPSLWGSYQRADFRASYETGLKQLLDTLGSPPGKKANTVVLAPPTTPVVTPSRKYLKWGAGLIIGSMAVILILALINQRPSPSDLKVPPSSTATQIAQIPPTITPTLVSAQVLPVKSNMTVTPQPTVTPQLPVLQGTPVPMPKETISAANADRVVELGRLGKGNITGVSYTPDQKNLILSTPLGFFVYDGKEPTSYRFVEATVPLWKWVLSPMGQIVAVANRYKYLPLLDLASGGIRDNLTGVAGTVSDASFSTDGQLIAATVYSGSVPADQVGTVNVWSWTRSLDPFRQLILTGAKPLSLAFAPDGKWIAIGLDNGEIKLWNWQAESAPSRTLRGHTQAVNTLAFSSDGTWLGSGSDDKTVRLWDWQKSDRSLEPPFNKHTDGIRQIAFTPDCKWLVSASDDHKVWLWPVSSSAQDHPLEAHSGPAQHIATSPDGTKLISTANDGTARIWSLLDDSQIGELTGFGDGAYGEFIAVSPDSAQVAAASWDGSTVKRWQLSNGTSLDSWPEQGSGYLAFSPDSHRLATNGWGGKIHVRDALSGSSLITISHPSGQHMFGIAFAPDGSQVAIGAEDGVSIWNSEGRLDITLPLTSAVKAVLYSPDGRLLAGIANDNKIHLWRASDGAAPYPPLEAGVRVLNGNALAFSLDGGWLASGSRDGKVRIWRTSDGNLLHDLNVCDCDVYSVALSPDGSLLAAGANDQSVHLLTTRDWKELDQPLTGYSTGVFNVAFSRNGLWLVTASWDGAIRLWGIPPN